MNNTNLPRILIVDDLKSARKVLVKLLSSLGYKDVTECEFAIEALECLKTQDFDLVISDLNLKDFSGMELFKQIRSLKGEDMLPFVLMTSDRSSSQDLNPTLARELSGFLLKPFNKEDIELKIKAALY